MAGAMALRTRFRVCDVTAFRAMRIGAATAVQAQVGAVNAARYRSMHGLRSGIVGRHERTALLRLCRVWLRYLI